MEVSAALSQEAKQGGAIHSSTWRTWPGELGGSKGGSVKDGSRVVVVTGLGGMGTATARRLGSGVIIVLADVDPAALNTEAGHLEEEGYAVVVQATDVSEIESVAFLAETAAGMGQSKRSFTPPDSLRCNLLTEDVPYNRRPSGQYLIIWKHQYASFSTQEDGLQGKH
jgi:shikimate 5-dehydrogenase